jgi:hypothetical protein
MREYEISALMSTPIHPYSGADTKGREKQNTIRKRVQ